MSEEKIVAKIFDFFITQRCTMNCKLCAAAVPYIKNPCHTPLETAKKEMEKFFEVWDYAERIEFIGGEPLMHPQIYDIVKAALKYREQFGKMRITTNATIVPSDELCQLIVDCGESFDFIVDDYGPELSKNLKPLTEKLDRYRIPYRIDIYHGDNQRFGGWIYFGDYKTVLHEDAKLKEVFDNCICVAPNNQFVCVYDGKAFSCIYAMCVSWMNGVFPNDNSCIDLFSEDKSLFEKREIARGFCQNPIDACKYCNGFDSENSKRYPGPPCQVPKNFRGVE